MTETEAPTRGRPLKAVTASRLEQIIELHDKGMTQKQIADEIGVTPAAVYYHLKKLARPA
jgi:hypothetical protein